MASNGGALMSLLDWAKTRDPDGKAADTAELLSQMNEVTTDALVREGNQTTGHRVTVRTGLPAVAWRKLNGGITPSKSTTAQLDESIGMLEALSVVDKDVAELDGDVQATRRNESMTFLESMAQTFAYTLFYGDTSVNPERFLGLSPRFSAISGALNGQNVLTGGGSGSDNTSIWLHSWGQKSSFLVFPRGSKAGIVQKDYGLDLAPIAAGAAGERFAAYQEHFQWKVGLVLKDWRYTVRIPNIDVPALVANTSPAPLIHLMSRALDRIPSFSGVKPVFYCNRTVFSWLRIQALAKSSSALAVEPAMNQFGTPQRSNMSFFGVPIRLVDQLLNTETTVS